MGYNSWPSFPTITSFVRLAKPHCGVFEIPDGSKGESGDEVVWVDYWNDEFVCQAGKSSVGECARRDEVWKRNLRGRRGKSLRRAETVHVHSTVYGKATRWNGQACPWVSPGLWKHNEFSNCKSKKKANHAQDSSYSCTQTVATQHQL